MVPYYRQALAALLILVCHAALAGAQSETAPRELIWIYPDFPPYNIATGANAGKGDADLVMQLLSQKIPGYHYRAVVAPPPRIFLEMRHRQLACTPDLLKTPAREKFIAFSSLPSMPPAILTLTVPRTLRPTLPEDRPLSLKSALEEKGMTIGAARGRSYGPDVDRLLRSHQSKVHYRSGDDIYRGLLSMLLAHRVHGVLGYAREANFVSQAMGIRDRVAIIPLKERTPQQMGYVGCSDTQWGRTFIRQVDKVLERERPTARYRQIMERWLTEESKPEFRRTYDKVFLQSGSKVVP